MKQVIIKDALTNQYYGVECANNHKGFLESINDTGSPSDNDFPFWTDDIEKAYNFSKKLYADNELKSNDLTVDGTRKPVIVVNF